MYSEEQKIIKIKNEILSAVKALPEKEQQDLWNYLIKNGFVQEFSKEKKVDQ